MQNHDILDQTLRDWIGLVVGKYRKASWTFSTTPEVVEHIKKAAKDMGMSASKVTHLAVVFGLAALTKYYQENILGDQSTILKGLLEGDQGNESDI
jgi:hypothetical protein